jgi:hypothetical protein
MIRAFATALLYYHGARALNLSRLVTNTQLLCLICLLVLQGLNIYWLLCIFRGIKRAITSGENAKDMRSDDEE